MDVVSAEVILSLPCCCFCCPRLRRRATTTINDGASIPDTLNTPRSSIDPVSQEVLMDLLDTWGAR
jgi:hypothetical protein